MGIENMRRWPMYIVFAVCIMLVLSLLNSWSMETELRDRLTRISIQLQECSKKQTSCLDESLVLTEQRDSFSSKVEDLDKDKKKLLEAIAEVKTKLVNSETKANHTLVDVEICKTELQSLQNLQLSKSATLETLRLEKDTLTTQLNEKKARIEELEKEVERLKAISTKPSILAQPSSKVTPTPAPVMPVKQSPSMQVHQPINEPIVDNDAKEEIEDGNINDFDQQFQ